MVRYEDMVKRVKDYTNAVYRFIGGDETSVDVVRWIRFQRLQHRRSGYRKERWKRELSESENAEIQRVCEELLQQLKDCPS